MGDSKTFGIPEAKGLNLTILDLNKNGFHTVHQYYKLVSRHICSPKHQYQDHL